MCRITSIISERPSAGGELLSGGPKSLLAQAAAVPGRFQDDGWGIGFFRAGGPAVIKSPRPARREPAAFVAAAAAAVSRVTVAHLRDASNPGKLPRARLVSRANTQPFAAEGLVFAHNGTLFIKDEIRSLLGAYSARVKGTNDSEVLFWQTVKMLDAYGDPRAALKGVLEEIRTVWLSCRSRYPGQDSPYSGLNLFLASAGSLTVLCHAPRKKPLGALLTPGWEYGRVAWRREPGRVIFSSEPADGGRWRKMNDPEIASARLRGGKIELDFERITL